MKKFVLFSLILFIVAADVAFVESKRIGVDVFCPTENEKARESYNEAFNLEAQGRLDEAIKLYKEAIKLDPGFCDAMDNLGLLYRNIDEVEKAVFWYKKSLDIFPENVVAHINLAIAHRLMENPEEAILEYESVVRLKPEYAEGYYGLGTVYFDLGQPDKALSNFKKAEEIYIEESSPHLSDARYYLGVSYLMLSDQEQAKKYLELAYPKLRSNPDVNFALGFCYLTQDMPDLEVARTYMKRARKLGMEIPQEILKELEMK